MEYINVDGGAGAGAGAGAGGFDATNIVVAAVQIGVGAITSSNIAKKQRALQERLGKLSLAQQKELAILVGEQKTALGKLNIVYQTFAVIEDNKLKDARKRNNLIVLGGLGAGILVLVAMSILKKR